MTHILHPQFYPPVQGRPSTLVSEGCPDIYVNSQSGSTNTFEGNTFQYAYRETPLIVQKERMS